MKKTVWVIGWLVLLGGTGFWLAYNQQTQQAQVQAAALPLPVTVTVAPVRRQSLTTETSYIGQSTYWREVAMTATTQGIVRRLYIRLNGSVREGQPLLRVDADVNEASLVVAEGTLAKARQDLVRYETLHRENNSTASEVENARLQVRNAEFQLLSIRKQVGDALIKAPIGGTITEKPIERGMFIAPGTPLATITDVSAVKVTISVPETELTDWAVGQVVPVRFEAYPGVPFRGTVHHIGLKGGDWSVSGTSVPGTSVPGRFPVEIRVNNANTRYPLRVGLTAQVSRNKRPVTPVLTIPRTAIIQNGDSTAVYVLQGQRVLRRPIQTGDVVGTDLVVRRGLEAGERIVVSGATGLRNGLPVHSSTLQP
ncbi:efflux RND transporter periplasmic adaptor subunit [Spirosoma sordidisoli]|uniref:Efflux RND transporter periplasmic adaptor subunit n=1 Tax=Spirosoma sordidisoli TaxID=2502893 RepID=A0A4Q2UP78_9BACT|nr:efflux RND transporter periplasmic adaptor subunit [Spirosoma sordidisoli]RYC69405.1 efflux RND transporter periplasmic adaptor subunit [Spirosoma sordidisoli]